LRWVERESRFGVALATGALSSCARLASAGTARLSALRGAVFGAGVVGAKGSSYTSMMRFASFSDVSTWAGIVVLMSGCSVYDDGLLTGGGGGTGATGANGGTASTSTMTSNGGGGSGGSVGCKTPTTCPGEDGPCGKRTCVDGVCGIDSEMAGMVVPDTIKGDCQRSVCDGMGEVKGEADNTDTPDDMKQCTTEVCNNGQVQAGNAAPKTPCTEGGGALCDGSGTCVECVDGTDCPQLVCTAQNTCAPGSCNDLVKNNGESDVDCGGPCGLCINGKTCNAATDCVSNECNVTCQPSCTDMAKTQDETDVDCGGTECMPCGFGLSCLVATDCQTGRCGANLKSLAK
jgi:hypothetical protein